MPYIKGIKTDDWRYDMIWAKGFYANHGINPFMLKSYLGSLFNSPGYVYLLAIFRGFANIFGEYSTIIPRIFNVFVLNLIALYSTKIFGILNNGRDIKISKYVFYTIALFPSLIFISVHVFRDIIIGFCIIHIFYFTIKYKVKFRVAIIVVAELFVLFTLRKSTFLLILALIPFILINPKKWKYYLPFLLIGGVVLIMNYFAGAISLSERLVEGYSNLNSERMGSIGNHIFSLPIYLGFIPRISFLIFSPVPSLFPFYQFFLSISTYFQIIFVPFLFWGIFNEKIDSRLKIVFLFFFLGVALTSASFRHTSMYLPIGIILVMSQFKNTSRKFGRNYFLTLSLLLFICVSSVLIAIVL